MTHHDYPLSCGAGPVDGPAAAGSAAGADAQPEQGLKQDDDDDDDDVDDDDDK
jgi:hypothetical protein